MIDNVTLKSRKSEIKRKNNKISTRSAYPVTLLPSLASQIFHLYTYNTYTLRLSSALDYSTNVSQIRTHYIFVTYTLVCKKSQTRKPCTDFHAAKAQGSQQNATPTKFNHITKECFLKKKNL